MSKGSQPIPIYRPMNFSKQIRKTFHHNLGIGLFHKGILQSGNSLCPWSFVDDPEKTFINYATAMNCSESLDSAPIIACLREKNASELVAVSSKANYIFNGVVFTVLSNFVTFAWNHIEKFRLWISECLEIHCKDGESGHICLTFVQTLNSFMQKNHTSKGLQFFKLICILNNCRIVKKPEIMCTLVPCWNTGCVTFQTDPPSLITFPKI